MTSETGLPRSIRWKKTIVSVSPSRTAMSRRSGSPSANRSTGIETRRSFSSPNGNIASAMTDANPAAYPMAVGRPFTGRHMRSAPIPP